MSKNKQRGPLTPKRAPQASTPEPEPQLLDRLSLYDPDEPWMVGRGPPDQDDGAEEWNNYRVFNKEGRQNQRQEEPDYNDPFGPAGRDPEQQLSCLHCDWRLRVKEVMWEPTNGGIWVCPNWSECGGSGIGFDLVPDGRKPVANLAVRSTESSGVSTSNGLE